MLELEVDGEVVSVADDGATLLDVLREQLGKRSPKDGCSPQGQCGCCTVLVDGQPRVACVTPARRVRGRSVTTLEGLPPEQQRPWAEAFAVCGASQCGFCTPGIITRLEGLRTKGTDAGDTAAVEQALLAHLCRCTGWRTILDAWETRLALPGERPPHQVTAASAQRAALEGHNPQTTGTEVALGQGGFADDTAPDGALVAVPDGAGGWAVGESLADARATAGKVQGRRSTVDVTYPLDLPGGDWDVTLQTTWVEPAYLETDASWCEPGGEPVSPLANGGAFGGKVQSVAPAAARELADQHGRPVRVLLSREDTVRLGPKRPPIAAGVKADGTGVIRVVRTADVADAIAKVAPGLIIEEVDVPGPATSVDLRGAGWVEATVLLAAARDRTQKEVEVVAPGGAVARAAVTLGPEPQVDVTVRCGQVLDPVVLRSYCIGASHMALSWVTSEALRVTDEGAIEDLTVRSFGILRAVDTPRINVEIEESDSEPVNGSDAVFAAVAAATWIAQGTPQRWPTSQLLR